MPSHKELKLRYKEARKEMGIYQIRNVRNGKLLIESSPNIRAIINRSRFSLKYGVHKDRELQKEWNEFGEESFAIEILDHLEESDEAGSDSTEELKALEGKWLKKLARRRGIYE
ncbi:MAG: GIY-YIG nuclease family protein [Candidatus Eremiobacteraeota bacterium]|nr:GIY-YIG nuclease family protein [Candidatus Eremiobacteraeota bacterium]